MRFGLATPLASFQSKLEFHPAMHLEWRIYYGQRAGWVESSCRVARMSRACNECVVVGVKIHCTHAHVRLCAGPALSVSTLISLKIHCVQLVVSHRFPPLGCGNYNEMTRLAIVHRGISGFGRPVFKYSGFFEIDGIEHIQFSS